MKIEKLNDRSLVLISGEDAEKFLENLITCKVEGLAEGKLAFGALLTPQGKIMFDFFILRAEEGFLFDIYDALRDDFLKRMTFYKLRAKVDISPVEDKDVYAVWDAERPEGAADPRHPNLGQRVYVSTPPDGILSDYNAHCIELNIPQAPIDFAYGDAYPHEVLMDQFGGVDFKKGCYVGQEVVSRMQHRGTTKKRIISIHSATELPDTGTAIKADGKPAGQIGSVSGNKGLALLRLDRIASASNIEADDHKISTSLPDWVSFNYPASKETAINE